MKPFDYATYGLPGARIPGSRYVRGYCPFCGAPVRTTIPGCPEPCADCDGHPRPGGTDPPPDEITGYQANALRCLES